MTSINPESIQQIHRLARVVTSEAGRHGLEEVAIASMMRGELEELLADSLRGYFGLTFCDKAGCNASTSDASGDGWHLPVDEDPRGGHNINTLTLCPACREAAQRIGLHALDTGSEKMGTMTDNSTALVQRVGTTDNGEYMVVRVEIREGRDTGQTVTHEAITEPVMELAIQGELWKAHTSPQGGHDPISAGQNRADLAAITKPAPGWTLDEIRELGEIWDRWHLNTMHAECAHMPADARARWDRREEVVCEAGNGYRYGTSWLVEELPADLAKRVQHLMRDRSHDLYAARGYDMHGNKYHAES